MAMTTCKECKAEISTQAQSCPKCGAKIAKTSWFTKFVLFFIILGVFGAIIGKMGASDRQEEGIKAEQARIAALTPEQRAKDATDKIAKANKDAHDDKMSESRFQNSVAFVKGIKGALLDPESARWKNITANEDGSVVCVEVIAKNGFGGLTSSLYLRHDEKIATDANSWNKYCLKSMYDEARVLNAI